jgi:hypothetical protein
MTSPGNSSRGKDPEDATVWPASVVVEAGDLSPADKRTVVSEIAASCGFGSLIESILPYDYHTP